MKRLNQNINSAIAQRVFHEIEGQRDFDRDTGEILEPYRSEIKFAFQVKAKNIEDAERKILFEAQKYFNSIFEVVKAPALTNDHVCELNTAFGHDECLICGKLVS